MAKCLLDSIMSFSYNIRSSSSGVSRSTLWCRSFEMYIRRISNVCPFIFTAPNEYESIFDKNFWDACAEWDKAFKCEVLWRHSRSLAGNWILILLDWIHGVAWSRELGNWKRRSKMKRTKKKWRKIWNTSIHIFKLFDGSYQNCDE